MVVAIPNDRYDEAAVQHWMAALKVAFGPSMKGLKAASGGMLRLPQRRQ